METNSNVLGQDPRAFLTADHARLEKLCRGLLEEFDDGSNRDLRAEWKEFEDGLLTHLAVEEKYILPPFARVHPKEAEQILREHTEIRRKLGDLGAGIDLHLVNRGIAQDLIANLGAHAMREEKALYAFANELDGPVREAIIAEVH
ncbi:MAG TPA: hemerythrin domain-containing protein [bacterium]|nr:hemerythrin domain-containing protein [bacterium]